MRIGKPVLKSRAWRKAGESGVTPQHVTSETVVGQVSTDLILSVLAPKIQAVASFQMERYAGEVLDYEEQQKNLVQQQSSSESTAAVDEVEVDVNGDGSFRTTEPLQPPPVRPLFHSRTVLDDFTQMATETSDHFFAKTAAQWKVQAKAAKFERMLDEKYGVFRPFIANHPEIERVIRSVQRKYATGYFSPFRQGDPPIPRSTAIVILFMMNRGGIRWEVMVLASVFFLVGLQPWALVAIVSLLHALLMRRKHRSIGTMPRFIRAIPPYYASASVNVVETTTSTTTPDQVAAKKNELLLTPVGTPLTEGEPSQVDTSQYDTIVLGSGPSSLFTAALMSRAGRKVLVLAPEADASGCLLLEHCDNNNQPSVWKQQFHNVPFDVTNTALTTVSKQQKLLAPVLCTTTDYQGGIRFAQVGTEADGHAYGILSIPGMGTERKNQSIPYVLRADGGTKTLMEDAACYFGDGWPDVVDGGIGNSSVGAYIEACESMSATSSAFHISKLLPEYVNNIRKSALFEECALRYVSSFLDKSFPLNPHLRSFMAGIGMRGENLKPSQASMATHVHNVCAASNGEGQHYPIGGPRALAKAFAHVIETSGGRIVTSVQFKELLFDEDPTISERNVTKPEEGPPPPRCVGVELTDGRQIRFAPDRYRGSTLDPAIVSLEGFISTFVRLLPEGIRTTYKVPRGLPALSERRPVFKILFAIRGSARDLGITGADYYRLPNASIALDVFDSSSGTVVCGEIGGSDELNQVGASEDIVESTNKENAEDVASRPEASRRKKSHRVKFHAGESWLHISFPSAKDPSFEQRHGNVTACVVTVEADDDFVTPFDTKPKLFVIHKETASSPQEKQRLLDKVTKDLLETYPELEGKIDHAEVRGPFPKGLSNTPERYAAKGIRADTPYPRLFAGGPELSTSDSFGASILGGWIVANAVMGYNTIDYLLLEKTITSDLGDFLETPNPTDDDDLAVPLRDGPTDTRSSVGDS